MTDNAYELITWLSFALDLPNLVVIVVQVLVVWSVCTLAGAALAHFITPSGTTKMAKRKTPANREEQHYVRGIQAGRRRLH